MVVDLSTGKIRSATNPTLDVDANFGSAFDVDVKGVRTGYNISSSYVNFYADYVVEATLGIPVGSWEAGITFEFGNHRNDFNAYPHF